MERRRQALSEINVTPLVDVMLVLLIIFMITAPLLQQGIDVNLPQAKGSELTPSERIVITIKKNRKIYVNKTAVTLKTLRKKISRKKDREVFLRADRDVPYGLVVSVMGELRDMGIEKIGMVTEPKIKLK